MGFITEQLYSDNRCCGLDETVGMNELEEMDGGFSVRRLPQDAFEASEPISPEILTFRLRAEKTQEIANSRKR